MTKPVLARRAAAVSATFILALGASGVAASAAFADTPAPTPAATASGTPADDSAEGIDPTYTLTDNGAGTYSLTLTIPGTSIAVDYTVDPTGTVTGASTSTSGATVAAAENDLTITLADGRVVKVELGDAGNTVDEVSVEPSPGSSEEANIHEDGNANEGDQGADSRPAPAVTASPESGDDGQEEGDQPQATTPAAPQPSSTASPQSDGESSGGGDGSGDSSGSGSDN